MVNNYVNQLVSKALNYTTNENYIFYPDEYQKYGFQKPEELEFAIMENHGEKVADMEIGNKGEVDVIFWMAFCPNIDLEELKDPEEWD